MYNVGIVQVGDQKPNFLGHPHGVVVHSGHLRLRLSSAAGSTGSISPNLARMMPQLGPFVGSILPTATATATGTGTGTGSMLLVVGISVGRKVGLLHLSLFCRDGAARRRRRPPFQVFSDGAALDMLQVNTRRGNDWSDAFDLTSAALLFYQPRERYTV